MTAVPIGEARDHLSRLAADVAATHERVWLTRHGERLVAMIAAEDLDALEETLDLLTTPGAAAAITEGIADLDAGRVERGPDALARFLPSSPLPE